MIYQKKNWRMWNISTIWVAWYQMIQEVHVKLNPGMPWQNQHLAERRHFSPANWT
jgi:hypothetical protein